MSKWSEKLVVKFLKLYKQYPCLWNPYDKRYYNCKEKNEALERIIDDLCIPGFTVTDYLQQIKLIREKYKREQLRTIKGLQTQKQYRSPVSWYNIVAEMLARVISDEEKINSVEATRIVRPDTSVLKSLSSDDIRYSNGKEAKTRIQPCINATCDTVARRSKSARSSVKYTARKTSEARPTARTKYVLFPQARNIPKARDDGDKPCTCTCKPKRDFDSKVPEYPRTPSNSINSVITDSTKVSDKKYEAPFLKCPSCGWEKNDKHEKVEQQEQRIIIPCSNFYSDSPGLTYAPCSECVKDKDATYRTVHSKTYTDDSGDFARDSSKPAPAKILKLDKGTQTTEFQAAQLDPEEKTGAIEACARFKIILSGSKKNSVGTHGALACLCDQGVQCSKPEFRTKGTQLSLELKKNDAQTSTVVYREWGTQCTVCVPEKRCSVSIQTVNQLQEKQVGVYTVKQNSQGSTARSSSLERTRDVQTSSSVQRVHSSGSVTTICHKSVGTGGECVLPSRAKSHGSLKRCVRQKDYKEAAVGETEAYTKVCNAETCPRNMSDLMKDPTVTTALQQFLCKMLSSRISRGSRCIKSQTGHEQKKHSISCATDATEMVKRIQEFAVTALEVHLTKDECVQTLSNAETVSVYVNKLTMTEEGLRDKLLVYRCTGVAGDGSERMEAPMLKEAKKLLADKEVCAHCEYRDIGTNGSLLQTRDTGVQSYLRDSVCSNKLDTDKQQRITVGTQKRDPILVRVIKCTESQTIKKSDKDTLTEDHYEKKFLDKRVEACGRPVCVPYTVCVSSYQEEPKYQCDDNCKGKLYRHQDWTDLTNPDAFNCTHTSKIPLYARQTRKCTFARSN